MINTRAVFGVAAAVMLVLAASPAAWAQTGIGSGISKVYRNPASGCGYGIGYLGPGCPYGGYVCSESGSCYYRFGPGNRFNDSGNEASTVGARRPASTPQH
jgi:hypothetical protein